jgi:hypothetical protein
MATAVVDEEIPAWVERHLNHCPYCRRGLAYVVCRGEPMSERQRDLAQQVAFVAKVSGLTREISTLHRDTCPDRRRWYPASRLDRLRAWLTQDWRVPSAAALALAVLSAGLAFYLILSGPKTSEALASYDPPPAPTAPARLSGTAESPLDR